MRTLLHVALITLVFMALPTGLSVLFRGTAARFLAATPIVIVIRTGAGFIVVLHRSSAIATVRMFSAFAADLGHVLAVRAYRLTALATCLTRFVGIELMSGTLFMSGPPALTGDLPLTFLVHRSKSAIGSILFCHCPALLGIYGY